MISQIISKIKDSPLLKITLILTGFSILIDLCAFFWADFNEPLSNSLFVVPYKKFFEVHAWYLFPLYFPIAALVIWQSWDAFINVWKKLPEANVIKGDKKVSNEVIIELTENFIKYRYYLILASFILGFICMYVDSERERNTMIHETTFSGQLARACEDPDFLSKWLWDYWIEEHKYGDMINPCSLEGLKEGGIKNPTGEQQYMWRSANILRIIETDRINFDNKRVPPPRDQWVTVWLFHLEDAILISLGWLVFLQSLAHSIFFCFFEKLKTARKNGLRIELNIKSDLNEFGLEHWNHALNNLYWYLSAALMIPILSRGAQRDLSNLDTSQVWLEILIPVLVAAPMITTIIVRQRRLPKSWSRLSESGDFKQFLDQRLWPLDKNWTSKLGVVLAFLILSMFLGVNIASVF